MPFQRDSKSAKDAGDVVVGEVEEEEEEKGDKGDHKTLHCFGFEGFSTEFFEEGKTDMPPIQNGDRKKIKNSKIDANCP